VPVNRGLLAEPVGNCDGDVVALAPAQQRAGHHPIDRRRHPRAPGEIYEQVLHYQREGVASQQWRTDTALNSECGPSPSVQTGDHSSCHQSMDKAATGDESTRAKRHSVPDPINCGHLKTSDSRSTTSAVSRAAADRTHPHEGNALRGSDQKTSSDKKNRNG
jgi:hypothetical protein